MPSSQLGAGSGASNNGLGWVWACAKPKGNNSPASSNFRLIKSVFFIKKLLKFEFRKILEIWVGFYIALGNLRKD
jgi:hypothetical protein